MNFHGIQEERATCFPLMAGPGHDTYEPDANDVSVNIKRTFIEVVPTPRHGRRLRSLTDTELLLAANDACATEISDNSTGEPSDAAESDAVENQQYAEWTSPSWGPSEDEFYSKSMVDTFALPTAAGDRMMDHASSAGLGPAWSFSLSPNDFFPSHWGHESLWQGSRLDNFQGTVANTWSGDAKRHAVQSQPDCMKTTIMLRNLPSRFTRTHVIELLEDEGFEGAFDLVYVPMDFSSKSCLGYGFVNFKDASNASRGWEAFDGFCNWGSAEQQAVCEVVWSDPHQGLEALIERYRNSPIMHESVPHEWKPAYFVDGAQVPFPTPTERVKAPKQKNPRNKAKKEYP